MKLTEIWSDRNKPTLSFEFFPPRTQKAAEDLDKTLNALVPQHPDFVSVTFGAGGSTRLGSHQLATRLKKEKALEVIAYFAGSGMGPEEILEVMEDFQTLGLDNILVVRGDLPTDAGFIPHPKGYSHAIELLKFLRPRFPFCMGVAGHPEGHIEASSKEQDLEFLRQKVAMGADFIITNFVYYTNHFLDFAERCRCKDIAIPILPGIMPIYSYKMMDRLAKICGTSIPDEVRTKAARLDETDKPGLIQYGIDLAVSQCETLIRAGVPGIHLYTMNRSESALGIVKQLRSADLM